MEAKQHAINDEWVNDEIKGEKSKDTLKHRRTSTQQPQAYGTQQGRKLSITGLCLKNQDKFRRKHLTLPSKELEKRTTNKTPSKQKKGNNKRVEINEIESKKQYQRSVKARAGSL